MRTLLLLLILLFSWNFTCAQDTLFVLKGKPIQALVLEITPEVIKYKQYDFQDGPLYTIYRKDVEKIRYANGRVEWFMAPPEKPVKKAITAREEEAPVEKVTEETVKEAAPTANAPIERSRRSRLLPGITGGLNIATGYYDYKMGPNPPFESFLLAPSVGLNLDWRITPVFSLQSNLGYRMKGDRIDMGDWVSSFDLPYSPYGPPIASMEAEGFRKTKLGYFEWSLLPVITGKGSIQIGLGGYAAIGLHGQESSDYTITYYLDGEIFEKEVFNGSRQIKFATALSLADDEYTRYINRLDYGLVGYLGFRVNWFTLGGMLNYGLEEWEPSARLFATEPNPTSTHHLTGMVFITFHKK